MLFLAAIFWIIPENISIHFIIKKKTKLLNTGRIPTSPEKDWIQLIYTY